MKLPFAERTSPRDIARAAAISGRLHEVVTSASKVLHGRELGPEDKDALRWARELLEIAASTDVVLAMPSAGHLAGVGNAAVAVRKAARSDGGDPNEALATFQKGLNDALKGRRDDPTLSAMADLRDVFSLVSRLSLEAEVVRESSEKPWALLLMTSRL
jgi:hypothetical protein